MNTSPSSGSFQEPLHKPAPGLPSLLKPPTCFLTPEIVGFQRHFFGQIHTICPFWPSFASHNHFRFSHAASFTTTLHCWVVFHCMDIPLGSIHQVMDTPTLPLWGSYKYIQVQSLYAYSLSFLLDKYQRIEWIGHMVDVWLLLKYCLFSKVVVPFSFLLVWIRILDSSHYWKSVTFHFFKDINSGSWWLCPCGLKSHFPGDWQWRESLHAYSLICTSSLVRCLLNIFAHLKNWIVIWLLSNFDNSLYILVKVFYQVCDFQIYSPNLSCEFCLRCLKSSRFSF